MQNMTWPEFISRTLLAGGLLGVAIAVTLRWEGWLASSRKLLFGMISVICVGPLCVKAITALVGAAGGDPLLGPLLTGCLVGMNGMIIIELLRKVSGIFFSKFIDGIFAAGAQSDKGTGDHTTEVSDEKSPD